MKKLLITATIVLSNTAFAQPNNTFAGNTVKEVLNPQGELQGFLLDGSKTVGQFAQINIQDVVEQGAGYVVIPAHDTNEMNNNAQFAISYIVDCAHKIVINDNTNQQTPMADMNIFHQMASNLACETKKHLN